MPLMCRQVGRLGTEGDEVVKYKMSWSESHRCSRRGAQSLEPPKVRSLVSVTCHLNHRTETGVIAFLTPFVVNGYRNAVAACRPPMIDRGSTILKVDYVKCRQPGCMDLTTSRQKEGAVHP